MRKCPVYKVFGVFFLCFALQIACVWLIRGV